jgi:hypothetical protein
VNGFRLSWELLSEPQKTSVHGYKGLCISVRIEDGAHRELVLEFPMPDKRTGNGAPQLPQRPSFSAKSIDYGISQAMLAGWEPKSRGKVFVHKVVG